MRIWFRLFALAVALAAGAGTALARPGETRTDLPLRTDPSPKAELLLVMPAGSAVNVGRCGRGWCGVTWRGYTGYAPERGLVLAKAAPPPPPPGPEAYVDPVYPPYPYHAGHYPTADSYFDLPPYAAISPSWYRNRYFLTFRERNRYRYVPHVFRNANSIYK